MIKLSPLQIVKRDFESKENLVDKLVDGFDAREGESTEDFRKRLLAVSNKKLLRLFKVKNRMAEEFGGDKGKLVDAIVGFKFNGKGDNDYRTKIGGYQAARLLDLHDSLKKKA